jgi:hypothetical protein
MSVVLSNTYMPVAGLLMLAREISKGRHPSEVARNAKQNAENYLRLPEDKTNVTRLLGLLHTNAGKNHRDLQSLRACPQCHKPIFMSNEEECGHCSAIVDWPAPVRALVCMDNILWMFEQRIEIEDRPELAQLICLLVVMLNDLLRKQESPSKERCAYALSLMASIKTIADMGRGAVLDMSDLTKPVIYVIQDKAREDSQLFAVFIQSEFETLIRLMNNSLRS